MIVPDHIVSRLSGVKATPTGIRARCPAHDSTSSKLYIDPGNTGWLLICFTRGCSFHEIANAMGLHRSEFRYDRSGNRKDIVPVLNADRGLNRLVLRQEVGLPDFHLESLDQVAWFALPREPIKHAQAGADSMGLAYLPFEDAMRYWAILRDGYIWEWLGERWMIEGHHKLDWHQFREWMQMRLYRVWRAH